MQRHQFVEGGCQTSSELMLVYSTMPAPLVVLQTTIRTSQTLSRIVDIAQNDTAQDMILVSTHNPGC